VAALPSRSAPPTGSAALASGPSTSQDHARLSGGRSNDAIHRMVIGALQARGVGDAVLVDVGCGTASLRDGVRPLIRRYVGVDIVRYERLPGDVEFHQADLNDAASLPELAGQADVVTAIEVIEHLENPRAVIRLMTRLARPGGLILATTPNQESLLSLACLVTRGRFSQFQDAHYPAHITALLAVDLRRIAEECGLADIEIDYSGDGRMVFSARHYPRFVSRLFPRACSDNVMLVARVLSAGC
jgi:2-polyprenyl-3-methyl-5-hydroxy-6-metoxy-1,4-benzoquinol methylase